jgi:Uma2 family endonuclease
MKNILLGNQRKIFFMNTLMVKFSLKKYFYPDVVVTCDERDTEPQLILFPCLIIEVLSPSTEAYEPLSETLRERGFKFSQYRKLESLQEYILVQVDRPIVEVFQHNQEGKWLFSEYGLGDRIFLKSINVEISVSDLYRQVQFDNDALLISDNFV